MQIMTAPAVSQLVYLLDEAFQRTEWHSLLGNLHSVTPEDWLWVPSGGQRSIRDIVQHVGGCKFMYHNHAFGDAQLTWDDPLVDGRDALSTIAEALGWLREGHARLRQSIAALDDAELLRPRMTNWGELKETRWIIAAMIEHDLYHAGEINHIRSLRHHTDQWQYV
jgi:DinB family protein